MENELERNELNHNFLCFCSLICIINGKKLNLPNIFLLVLKNEKYKNLLKYMLTIDNDYDLLKYFIDYDYTIAKSKYISKYLNSNQGIKIKKDVYGFRKDNIQRVSKRIKKVKKSPVQTKEEFRKNKRKNKVVPTKTV
jgi:pantothenate kinase